MHSERAEKEWNSRRRTMGADGEGRERGCSLRSFRWETCSKIDITKRKMLPVWWLTCFISDQWLMIVHVYFSNPNVLPDNFALIKLLISGHHQAWAFFEYFMDRPKFWKWNRKIRPSFLPWGLRKKKGKTERRFMTCVTQIRKNKGYVVDSKKRYYSRNWKRKGIDSTTQSWKIPKIRTI